MIFLVLDIILSAFVVYIALSVLNSARGIRYLTWLFTGVLLLVASGYLSTPALHLFAQALVIVLVLGIPILFHQEWQLLLNKQQPDPTSQPLTKPVRTGISIAIALVLVLVTLGSATRVGQIAQDVPIIAVNLPTGMSAKISGAQSVSLLISAPRSDWSAISPDAFSAVVDTAQQTEGGYDLPISVSSKISGVKILRITPSRAFVNIEPIISKTVPVTVKYSGKAGDNLVPGEAKVTPEKVEVSGPKSVIADISQAIAPISLNGETKALEQTITLQAEYSTGEIISNLVFKPTEVKLEIPLVVPGKTKTVGIKPVVTGNPGNGYWVSSVTITPPAVAVTGSADALAELTDVSTVAVNIAGKIDKVEEKVKLSLPAGITLAESVATVTVTVNFSKTDTSKSLNPEIVYAGLSDSLKVTSISPTSVTSVVSGAVNLISGLTGGQVKLNLDLSPFQSAGTYSVAIKNGYFDLPEGISLVSFLPSALNVTLENK